MIRLLALGTSGCLCPVRATDIRTHVDLPRWVFAPAPKCGGREQSHRPRQGRRVEWSKIWCPNVVLESVVVENAC